MTSDSSDKHLYCPFCFRELAHVPYKTVYYCYRCRHELDIEDLRRDD